MSVNSDYELFKKLDLLPNDIVYIGSEIPKINEDVEYLSSILPLLSGLEFLKHKKYVEDIIDKLKKRIERLEIEELIHR